MANSLNMYMHRHCNVAATKRGPYVGGSLQEVESVHLFRDRPVLFLQSHEVPVLCVHPIGDAIAARSTGPEL
jgi:hypothetical protein